MAERQFSMADDPGITSSPEVVAGPAGAASGAASSGSVGLSARPRWTMLSVLTLFAALSSIDKNFLSLLVADIKRDLGLTDVQMGLIIGLAFALSNVAMSLPAGWLADRFNRRGLVAGAVALWSVMAALCGCAGSFAALFMARVGVGLGEGLSPPSSYSLIRDGVPEDKRGRAYGFFSMGATVGGGLSFVLGGALLGLVVQLGTTSLPLIGEAKPWQITLILIGVAGLPLSLLAFAFPDPGRPAASHDVAHLGFGDTLRLMARHRRVMLPLLLYSVALSILTNSWGAWAPAVIARNYGLTPQQVGPTLGTILMIGAPIGLIGAGILMDRLARNGAALVAGLSAFVMLISVAAASQAPSIQIFWVPQLLITITSTAFLPVTSTVVARTVPSEAVGKTIAIFLLAQGALGAGLGPVVTALVARTAFGDGQSAISDAMVVMGVVLGALATFGGIALRARHGTARQAN